MLPKLKRIISVFICFLFIFEQTGFAQVAAQLDIVSHLRALHSSFIQDKFRPLHLRYLQYNPRGNTFRLLLDKGDFFHVSLRGRPDQSPGQDEAILQEETKKLLRYFLIGLTLPNDSFWVNLRPDSPDNIIDPYLAQTDIGRIMLETDLQLKKDTASATSPQTPEGKEYWNKLYQKAEELFGNENITIPTFTRPWIVPDEIMVRETTDSAYIYKATLKVMLEQDYLKDSATYSFNDPRLKALNEYSSQLIRELIIPRLTREINSSKRYASLRQVYYSLIMAQWFKARFTGKDNHYAELINTKNLVNLTCKESYSKDTYFKEYQKSFKDGEYKIQEPVSTPFGQTIRSYFSGGENLNALNLATAMATSGVATGTVIQQAEGLPLPTEDNPLLVKMAMDAQGNPAVDNTGSMFPVRKPELTLEQQELRASTGDVESRRVFLKKLGLAGIAAFLLGSGETVSEGATGTGAQKVYLLYHSHLSSELSGPYQEALYAPLDRWAPEYIKAYDGWKSSGDKNDMDLYLRLMGYKAGEYDEAYNNCMRDLSEYRIKVTTILSNNKDLINNYREEAKAIEKIIIAHHITKIAGELTEEMYKFANKSAPEVKARLIRNLSLVGYPDAAKRADDLFLLISGLAFYLCDSSSQSIKGGSVKLVPVESSQLHELGLRLLSMEAKASDDLLKMRPDIEKRWGDFRERVFNPDGLLSSREVKEELSALFKDNQSGMGEARNAINLALEFRKNSDARDDYIVKQLVRMKENIIVVRGANHRPAIKKVIDATNNKSGPKIVIEEIKVGLMGRWQCARAQFDPVTGLLTLHDATRIPKEGMPVEDEFFINGQNSPRDIVLQTREPTEQERKRIARLNAELGINTQFRVIIRDEAAIRCRIFGLASDNFGFLRADIFAEGNDEQVKEALDHESRELTDNAHDQIRAEQYQGGLRTLITQLSNRDKLALSLDATVDKTEPSDINLENALIKPLPDGSNMYVPLSVQGKFSKLDSLISDKSTVAEIGAFGLVETIAGKVVLMDLILPEKIFDFESFMLEEREAQLMQLIGAPGLHLDLQEDRVVLRDSKGIRMVISKEAFGLLKGHFQKLVTEENTRPIKSFDSLKLHLGTRGAIYFIDDWDMVIAGSTAIFKDVFWEKVKSQETKTNTKVDFFTHHHPQLGLAVIILSEKSIEVREKFYSDVLKPSTTDIRTAHNLGIRWMEIRLFGSPADMRSEQVTSRLYDVEELVRQNPPEAMQDGDGKSVDEKPVSSIGSEDTNVPDRGKGVRRNGESGMIDTSAFPSRDSLPSKSVGGIDFRNLPIVAQAVSNLSVGIGSIPLARLNGANLDLEWQQIERLVNSGITPSGERIKEYLQASCYNGRVEQDKKQVVICISNILRMEEDSYTATEPVLRDILIVLESGRSSQELKAVFTGNQS